MQRTRPLLAPMLYFGDGQNLVTQFLPRFCPKTRGGSMRAILHMGATAAAIVTLVLAVEATMTLAAGTTGSIYGTVTDQSGARLADVSVSAAAPSYTAKTVTNASGFYSLLGLPPDT